MANQALTEKIKAVFESAVKVKTQIESQNGP